MAVYRDEERKSWYVKFSYKDWLGQTKHTTKRGFKTRREAVSFEYEFKKSAAGTADITLKTLAEKYLADANVRTKPTTYRAARMVIRRHILPYFGERKITDLTPAMLRQWQNHLISQGFKPGTLSSYNRRFSALLNYAVRFYGLNENPLRRAGSVGRFESSKTFWEIDEYKRFIAAVDNPKYNLIFNLLFYSGMRFGEMLALDVEDFDFNKNTISITKNRPTDIGIVSTTKTPESVRTVEMPPAIMAQAKAYFERLDEPSSPVFPMTAKAVREAFTRGVKASGVARIRIHDLRHSHASFLITHGVPITAIAKRLGHKTPQTTLRVYSHFYEDEDSQIATLLQRAME